MFTKKNKDTARKVEVKDESGGKTVEVKINRVAVAPLVKIEKHEHRVNGQAQRPTYRIGIAERDIITLSPREYDELFMEMLRHKDAGELIHDIAEVHAEEHAQGELEMVGIAKGLGDAIEQALKSR